MSVKMLTKRDGRQELFDPLKLIRWSQWAAKHLAGRIDWHKIVRKTLEQLDNASSTKELQNLLIQNCLNEGTAAGHKMAGRLYASVIHKELYNDEIPTIKEVHSRLIDVGLMEDLGYTDLEYEIVQGFINHRYDFTYTHGQLDQLRWKYGLRSRRDKKDYESAQFVLMRIAMGVFSEDKTEQKLLHVREMYELLAQNVINAPSPNFLNIGTKHRGLASCVLYAVNDTAPSIAAGNLIAETMTYMSAGIGGTMLVRSLGDKVRGGAIVHQGKLPYYRATSSVVISNTQAGRGGALNQFYSGYDPEAAVIGFAQNPRAADKKKNRDMHFTMVGNAYLAHLAATGSKMFTFNCHTAPDLFKAFYSSDIKKFIELYNKYDQDPNFPKEYVDAQRFIRDAMQQSYEVGTHYMAFIDEMNRHTSFREVIHSSNLCNEICEPTFPFDNASQLYDLEEIGYVKFVSSDENTHMFSWSQKIDLIDPVRGHRRVGYAGELEEGTVWFDTSMLTEGERQVVKKIIHKKQSPEVALCSLAGLVTPNIKDDEMHEKAAYYSLRMIDYCIHRAHYELPYIGYTAKNRMNAGVGIVGLATHMARKNLKYSTPEGLQEIHRVAEDHAYFLIKASLRIARERGNAPWIHKTKWSDGWLPIDTYHPYVDKLVPKDSLRRDWEGLRSEIKVQGGIGHSCLIADMPTESSSKGAGMPNGPYPVRKLVLMKSDQDNVNDWVAPDSDLIGDQYELAYTIPIDKQTDFYAVMQKFTDMAISADTYRDRSKDIFLSSADLVQEYVDMARKGMKTRYYANVLTPGEDDSRDKASICGTGGCTL